jgi:hypothetical protein
MKESKLFQFKRHPIQNTNHHFLGIINLQAPLVTVFNPKHFSIIIACNWWYILLTGDKANPSFIEEKWIFQ